MLSTIILNWNRRYLLEQCVESYLETVGNYFEFIIVDNASTDGSIEYLRTLEANGSARLIYLNENMGGEAFNRAVPLSRGDLIHLSENDQIFLPGWYDHVVSSFDSFGDLGQLSLFSDTPTDEEVWESKASNLRFSNGKILYEAHGNVGASSIVKAELFRDKGIRVGNIEEGPLKFPNDRKLSADIKTAGFWCAWSDRYYVRNVGHERAEFDAHQNYYIQNYASKSGVGVAGWKARIAYQSKLPRTFRRSLAFPDSSPVPEKTQHAVNGTPARMWSMFDGFTAEVEVLDLLMVLTHVIKPTHVLETGTWLGLSSCAIARGLVANGFGHLTTLEVNAEAHSMALKNLAHYEFTSVVDAWLMSSMEYVPEHIFDMAVFDSEMGLRVHEFRRFKPSLREGALVIFHDTAPHHSIVIDGVRSLIDEGAVLGVDLPTPRGVFVGRVSTSVQSSR